MELAPLAGGRALSSPLITRTGSTGTATLSALNTSGTNTLSGAVTLNSNLTISTATGGTLAMTGPVTSTGELGDMLSHRIDFAQHLVGPMTRLVAQTKRLVDTRGGQPSDLDDWVAIIADFQNGATGVLESSKLASGRNAAWRSWPPATGCRARCSTGSPPPGPRSFRGRRFFSQRCPAEAEHRQVPSARLFPSRVWVKVLTFHAGARFAALD